MAWELAGLPLIASLAVAVVGLAHPEPTAAAPARVVPGLGGVPLQHRRAGNHQQWSSVIGSAARIR